MIYDFFQKRVLTDFFSAQVPSIKNLVQRYCFFLIYANFLETFFTFVVSMLQN